MEQIATFDLVFLTKMIAAFACVLMFALGVAVKLMDASIVRRINMMAACVDKFTYESVEERAESIKKLKALKIRSGDEIEHLYNAFVSTLEQSMQFVENIQNNTDMMIQMENSLIMVLADIVESRDKSTGDHIKKTSDYVRIIVEEMKRLGFYKDQLTEGFMNDVIHSAPLHDIGKINVPDSILNKPGKLTAEEFEIMKSHSKVGGEIIQRALDMVPESDFLLEAKKMAEYHHEKWDGKGYPHGLKGEAIPLSARIMAVADVFDALVSKRCYKKPFSYDKAMFIIESDAGTHFDPLVARAFITAGDKVREVMEKYEGISNPFSEEIDYDGSTDTKRESIKNTKE